MAAYAALVSLKNLLEQLQRHPRPPITLDTTQVETLNQKIAFLQHFLEVYNSHYSKLQVERLRNHIADVVYAAEDVIETHIIDRIHARSTSDGEGEAIAFSRDLSLDKVIRDMGFVEKEVLEIKDRLGAEDPRTSVVVASKSTSTQHNNMVGFDDILHVMLDKLTGRPHSHREIIPISGMGGMGKTTLARNVYIHPLIEYHFDIRAWVTISQEYNVRDILLGVLRKSEESMREKSEAEIGKMLYNSLCGRKYLIVMDDIWSHEAWDRVKHFFPDQCYGSRIVVTTRLTNVASYLSNRGGLEMQFLDQDKSWSLFLKTVFGEEEGCPSELEHVGKEISRNCKGLPLSIVVIGGLLAKSKQTHDYWKYIAENLNSVVNLEENERCLKILHASYDQLPAHLKACFLFMGVFPEDHEIAVSELIGMWVAESFLKPINGKDLEESAEEHLMELAGRNLIMVREDEFFPKKKICNIHDLLRDLCLREAQKEKFICVANQHGEGVNTQRRVAIHQDTSGKECLDSLKGGLNTRSLICYSRDIALPLAELRLLRVFTRFDAINEKDMGNYSLEDIFRLVNVRYLSLYYRCPDLVFPSSVSQLWNLQTLYVSGPHGVAPPEIWKLPLIRHIWINGLMLPDPPSAHTDERDDFVLHELRTFLGISNLKLGEEVIKRIPNVSMLELFFDDQFEMPLTGLKNLKRLYKLEDFSIRFDHYHTRNRTELLQNLIFPHSLKKLALRHTKLHWEDISTKIGSLAWLQTLVLDCSSFLGLKWKTVEGQFCSLKYLKIELCRDLKCWSTESTHFPCLEYLHLVSLYNLEEIPLCIGDIPTLKSIIIRYCSDSVIISAKGILDEQEELGNEGLRVKVKLHSDANDKSLESLATHNFQFEAEHWST